MIKIYFDLCTADSNLILFLISIFKVYKHDVTQLVRTFDNISKVRILYLAAQSLDVRVYH